MKYLVYILVAVTGLFFTWNHFFDVYLVSHHSMASTLIDGDKVLVHKSGISAIKRSGIILFKQLGGVYIKRCVGLPGEKVEIKAGKVIINNKEINTPATVLLSAKQDPAYNQIIFDYYNNNWTSDDFGPVVVPKAGWSIDLNRVNLNIYKAAIQQEQQITTAEAWDKFISINKKYTFQQDYFFVLGDNRHHSEDSRTFGYIAQHKIIGITERILFSYADAKRTLRKIE
ncbi:signal peptidase I [Chitinophaga niastensis]|uniref:Signal peptidase I n=1 Tax=Chitinophaga niastensis TaxID=536980 RepID=A0A2P8HJY4_CHINA|nr:signal peptidase I [Chitinophaga niastensis]PSL46533.1 signal peptidase I [Chitinophaga niastensis]